MIFPLLACLRVCCAGLLVLAIGQAGASVVMNNTRVIYVGGGTGESLQFRSSSAQPDIVQVWLDSGDPASTPMTADAPFIATPQIFRIEPDAGQTVHLMYTGRTPAADRETLYYLNFSQLPAMKDEGPDSSRLILMFNSRLKVFYRPQGLEAPPADLAGELRLQREGDALRVHNPTPYHVVVRSAKLLSASDEHELAESELIAPFSHTVWRLPAIGQSLRLVLVNDYGADTVSVLELP